MGEYAIRKSDGEEIKIGTCECMYYLRYEDRWKVQKLPNSLDPSKETDLYFRLPFPDEDSVLLGNYTPYKRGERLYRVVKSKTSRPDYCEDFHDPEIVTDPGIIQLTHESGLLVNVPCFHGEKLPELGGAKTFWNGKAWCLELSSIKNTEKGIFPIVHCRFCGHAWRYAWEEIMPYLHGEMKIRLEKYAPIAEQKNELV